MPPIATTGTDLSPVDSYDLSNLQPVQARAMEWHYIRPNDRANGKDWHFVYPGRYNAPKTMATAPTFTITTDQVGNAAVTANLPLIPAVSVVLGCVADDYTGASDLANTLTKDGLRTVQTVGIPAEVQALPDVDARERLCATRLLRCAPWELRENEPMERLRERAEGVRVAYVAATRARERLILSVPSLLRCLFWRWVLTNFH